MNLRVVSASVLALALGACSGSVQAPVQPSSGEEARPADGTLVERGEVDGGVDAGPAIPEGSYGANLFSRRGSRLSTWDVDAGGGILATPWMTYQQFLDRVNRETGSNPKPRMRSPVSFAPSPPSGATPPRPQPMAATASNAVEEFLISQPIPGLLAWKKGRGEPVRLQWYGPCESCRSVGVFWPDRKKSWPVVISDAMLSPGGPLRAVAKGDIDGDGLDDLAFVAEGVDGCDRAPCRLYWMVILMTATHTVAPGGLLLVASDTAERFEKAVGAAFFSLSGKEPRIDDAVTWRGRIEPHRYEVTAQGPSGSITWTASLDQGVLSVSPKLPPDPRLRPLALPSRSGADARKGVITTPAARTPRSCGTPRRRRSGRSRTRRASRRTAPRPRGSPSPRPRRAGASARTGGTGT